MTIKEFIEAAIKGGWESNLPTLVDQTMKGHQEQGLNEVEIEMLTIMLWNTQFSRVALDPNAWKAVGKVKGWPEPLKEPKSTFEIVERMIRKEYSWSDHMLLMVHALIEGKNLKDYLATL